MAKSEQMSRLRENAELRPEPPPGSGADKLAFVHRLQTILAHWPSADRLARAMGVSPSAFRKWLKGEAEPSRERLIALARAAGVGVAWLAEGEGPEPFFEMGGGGRRRHRTPDIGDEPDLAQFVAPVEQAGAQSAGMQGSGTQGSGAQASGARPGFGRFLALRSDWVRAVCGVEPEHLALDTAADEAMAPTIKPRDTLLLDTAERRVVGNGIYVLMIGDQRQIRRVQRRHDGSLLLITDNRSYQPDVIDNEAASSITVLGRVVWVGSPV